MPPGVRPQEAQGEAVGLVAREARDRLDEVAETVNGHGWGVLSDGGVEPGRGPCRVDMNKFIPMLAIFLSYSSDISLGETAFLSMEGCPARPEMRHLSVDGALCETQ
ncbi:hypothetical protein MOPEL_030_00070 [Mobilicoccus pelagius NBRC 104925]|uniref:Uncharacterized protein n=1 Tax=Mobilicoccus pelagius NBRC 104925 TaxID=1089455 RepID=H5UQ88_9MICO|nr:hypothetical protein MOPEL_030_00070 [Mobilicoccus pelagius NBRC 104925]